MAEMKNLTINGTPFTLPFALAGYGLGETQAKFLTSADDLNSQNKSGWYHWGETAPANAPTLKYGPNYSFMRVDGANEANFVQTVWSKYGDARGLMVTRVVIGGTPSEWEWFNPPMEIGVEYRTTKRHNGKVVYTKLVQFGALPNNAEKSVIAMPENSSLIAAVGYGSGSSYNVPIPGYYAIVSIGSTRSSGALWIKTSIDMTSYNGWITIEYTK